mmetsp:Transcript_65588/g.90695  ORF Transcript_65588/g.90695 Transcript_65588/m.90695 type:complete len:229 (+) Transcript_65588:1424-2110(+)
MQLGHCFFKQQKWEQALEQYTKAIRVSNLTREEITDELIYHRAGTIYIQQELWEDAKVMFLMCSDQFKTSFAFFNLGVAACRLESYEEAEAVLSHANYLDPSHADTWAFLTLVLLRNDERYFAAFQTMNEAIKLNLSNVDLTLEIAQEWIQLGSFKGAKESYEHALKLKAGPKSIKKVIEFINKVEDAVNQKAAIDLPYVKVIIEHKKDILNKNPALSQDEELYEAYI